MFINATTRQQISVYSKLTFVCLYPPHLEKWGVQKIFFARSARESYFLYPSLLESRRRPCAQYLPSYRLICYTKYVLFFGIFKYVCDIVVKCSRSLSHLLMSSTCSRIRRSFNSLYIRMTGVSARRRSSFVYVIGAAHSTTCISRRPPSPAGKTSS